MLDVRAQQQADSSKDCETKQGKLVEVHVPSSRETVNSEAKPKKTKMSKRTLSLKTPETKNGSKSLHQDNKAQGNTTREGKRKCRTSRRTEREGRQNQQIQVTIIWDSVLHHINDRGLQ